MQFFCFGFLFWDWLIYTTTTAAVASIVAVVASTVVGSAACLSIDCCFWVVAFFLFDIIDRERHIHGNLGRI